MRLIDSNVLPAIGLMSPNPMKIGAITKKTPPTMKAVVIPKYHGCAIAWSLMAQLAEVMAVSGIGENGKCDSCVWPLEAR